VGKNLTYISQLDGLTFQLYASSVLPRLLDQVGPSGWVGWGVWCL
jgi:vacuolar protein sorting-associated protein 35